MEASPAKPQVVSQQFLELVGRALTDEEYRDLLYSDRDAATSEYSLTAIDEEALNELTRERLESQVEVMTHAASNVTISIKVSVKF
jgi:hypothetical protein